ncbi:hypothetical protein GCM10010245_82990 [Streptomyces spectabilis]|nr:hypothetical protein GCM10010245_82990 [Streptomyces spectabilis]
MSTQPTHESALGDDRHFLWGYVERDTATTAPSHSLRVWCSWCCVWHQHSLPGGARAGDSTHRSAHCYAPDSPYRFHSVQITVSAASFGEVRGTVREATPRQQSMISQRMITPAVARLRRQTPAMALSRGCG